MTGNRKKTTVQVHHEKNYPRFNLGQRWEHLVLILSATALLLTGLPQKYRDFNWSQDLLSTPARLELIQQIHHIAAIVLTIEVLYHLGRAIYLMSKRKLSGEMFPTLQDVFDAGQMLKYLFFLRKDKPKFGRYNFEQKITYWFIFFGILIMGISGFIIWFPEFFTKFLPGGVIPAAKLAHSTESIVAAIFILIWHIYHVHIERLNLSMFTGRLSENEMREIHAKEYERINHTGPKNTDREER
jgi:formate dehydrogenase gamma subunit